MVDLSKLLGAFSYISQPFIALANTHYSEVAESNISNVETGSMSPTAYIEWANSRARLEEERARATMDEIVAGQVVNVVRVQAGYKMSKRIVTRGKSIPSLVQTIYTYATALEEALDLSDGEALSRLYGFSVDVQVFGEFVECLKIHIEASRLYECRSPS
jgi:hypothetical protein